ncbi:MAG TPA: LCP family protein [Acidimicrobiales bacterium]
MTNGRDDTSGGRRRHSKRSVPNENRLAALGEAVDGQSNAKVRRPRRRRGTGKKFAIAGVVVVLVVAGVVGGSYAYARWRFDRIPKVTVAGEAKPISGQPFNILMIGSDSRVGLSGLVAKQTGATSGSVAGQRSDVVKIIHVDPDAGTISMVSIPRDTMVTLLANQSLYGQFNRINVNFGNGPSLLAQTITANFGIPINQTIVVSFAGLINAADALGGVYLDFPYPSWDPYSGLRILHPGCQLVTGFQALALTRSRHFYYNVDHATTFPNVSEGSSADGANELYDAGWVYDGTSDFGRIDRQNAFLRAMVDQAKKLYNPLTINSFLSKLPQGITLDQNFSLNELIGLAVRFHSINPNAIQTWTMPTVSATNTTLGDVLYVEQPEAQQMLVNIFGSELKAPADPPPDTSDVSTPPPTVTSTTQPAASLVTSPKKTSSTPTTTTTNPTLVVPNFDPVPCTP